ncbi:BREX system serine/threonine kinase PglW [Thermomonospora cellulosilytica]|uniref:Serine/threonine protein kinase n=1 Tax=Thermomonospora cellulosilytica TaxID=1411118 RepID=A0A7W3RA76_9ACTN|nr:BREX system serine/threonine kinase PglW [Thermomonospora cellulosilytica]MBA9005010.1 serine/threonine protein kinase [Thermomonospora cellulosilytica]
MTNRWWGPRSDFPWEEEALAHIRERMPQVEPYRAWQSFDFTAKSGHVHQVDLLIATRAGLFLVEIKSHPGRATNSGSTWIFHGEDRTRTLENPLYLTNLKCKQLREQLEWARDELGLPRTVRIPYIRPAIFLSAPDLVCAFDDVQKTNVYGRDGLEDRTGLPGIWTGLLGRPPRNVRDMVEPATSRQLHRLLTKIGISGLRKHRRIGPFELEPRAFDAGPTWEDYLATNPALPGDRPRRIRIYLSELRATREERESVRRAARREYLALQGIAHEGIAAAEQFSDEHEAGPAVIFRHGADWRRLDHFIAEHSGDLPIETRVEMVRQLAEALDHAHRRHLYHRALAARSVYVEMDGRYPRLRICDWQVSARPSSGSSGRPGSTTFTSLGAHVEGSAGPYLAPEFGNPDAEGVQLDVFGLGALTHLVLTGRPPAQTRSELHTWLAEHQSLVPSAVCDDISPSMDQLVQNATQVQPVDRYESVRAFLDFFELVEQEVAAPAGTETPDLLDAPRGTVVDGWEVTRILGKGSTARALLVSKDGQERVWKVALNESGRERLEHEAAQLRRVESHLIVKLLEEVPVKIGPRWALVLERAGQQTLAQYLRAQGRLTIDELAALGQNLFQAVGFLEEQGVWHRDIKPDNLAIRELPRKGRRLVLFDFSLAGTTDRAIEVGTPPYLDPFLGTDRRPVYDAAAERYAVAVTLHEMASAELPSWGDGVAAPRLLDPSEQVPQLAEDSFDPLLRDRLVAFFRRALHRDAAQRHGSLREMELAWLDVFRDLDRELPATTPRTVRRQPADPDRAREQAAETVTADTPLVLAGLTARALSTALQQLEVSTVGELVKIPSARIQRLRGVGLGPRNELVKRAREWRQQLAVAERAAPAAQAERSAAPDTDPALLSLDEVAAQLVPKDVGRNRTEVRIIRAVLALPGADGTADAGAWASQAAVAKALGNVTQPQVARALASARVRWTKNVPAVTALRATVLEILQAHGRVMEAGRLAAALLAARGSLLEDRAARRALAAGCLRAAVETEEHLDNPRLARRRAGGRVLIAAVAEGDPTAPVEEELLDYAEALGARADELVDLPDAAPLPSPAAVRAALAGVPRPEGMPPLSDLDLVSLAADASRNAAMTARLELYPRDLDPRKALRLAQAASYLGPPGITPQMLRERVLARFPDLDLTDDSVELLGLLRQELGATVHSVDGRLVLPTRGGFTTFGSRQLPGPATRMAAATPDEETRRRLAGAAGQGGFLAVKVWLDEAAAAPAVLADLPGVTGLNVTEAFVTTLRGIVEERGRPRWETVLAADRPDASPAARTGFARLVEAVWERLEARVRAAEGTVLLHDAAPLTRYQGGMDLLTRLKVAARDPAERPHGLWLLCPMADPRQEAALDRLPVGAMGENEQLTVPSGFFARPDLRRAL